MHDDEDYDRIAAITGQSTRWLGAGGQPFADHARPLGTVPRPGASMGLIAPVHYGIVNVKHL